MVSVVRPREQAQSSFRIAAPEDGRTAVGMFQIIGISFSQAGRAVPCAPEYCARGAQETTRPAGNAIAVTPHQHPTMRPFFATFGTFLMLAAPFMIYFFGTEKLTGFRCARCRKFLQSRRDS
jgi:hypothetical protein